MQYTKDDMNLLSSGYEPAEADELHLNDRLAYLKAWKIKDVIVVHQGVVKWKWHDKQTDRAVLFIPVRRVFCLLCLVLPCSKGISLVSTSR